jgi:hypothetical protein
MRPPFTEFQEFSARQAAVILCISLDKLLTLVEEREISWLPPKHPGKLPRFAWLDLETYKLYCQWQREDAKRERLATIH